MNEPYTIENNTMNLKYNEKLPWEIIKTYVPDHPFSERNRENTILIVNEKGSRNKDRCAYIGNCYITVNVNRYGITSREACMNHCNVLSL